ncbi:MAG TPA: ribosomal L7Ae/L30e/S12e/Gadd45 family protein [Bacillota bacterium]
MQQIKDIKDKIVGLKQTLRALQQGKIAKVYIANDVDEHVWRKVTTACREYQVPLVKLNCNQGELGQICQIEVGAAVVALPKQFMS